jgi:hypothetical protein
MRLILYILVAIFVYSVMISLAQPALAACPCAGDQQQSQSQTQSQSINGQLVSQDIPAVKEIQGIQTQATIAFEETRNIVAHDITSIIGKIKQSTGGSLTPIIEKFRNRTVYRVENTTHISIANDIIARIRPIADAIQHISINATPLVVNEVSNPALQVGVSITKPSGEVVEKSITIVRIGDRNRLNISVEGVAAETDADVVYDRGTIFIEKLNRSVQLKTLPDRIQEIVQEKWSEGTRIMNMELELVQERLRYKVKTRANKHILGLFPVEVEEDSDVDADTGAVRSTRGPWWGFLAW